MFDCAGMQKICGRIVRPRAQNRPSRPPGPDPTSAVNRRFASALTQECAPAASRKRGADAVPDRFVLPGSRPGERAWPWRRRRHRLFRHQAIQCTAEAGRQSAGRVFHRRERAVGADPVACRSRRCAQRAAHLHARQAAAQGKSDRAGVRHRARRRPRRQDTEHLSRRDLRLRPEHRPARCRRRRMARAGQIRPAGRELDGRPVRCRSGGRSRLHLSSGRPDWRRVAIHDLAGQ